MKRDQTLAMRRSASALLAATLSECYPNVELVGPGSEGHLFYYDFLFPHPISPETLPIIEQQMKSILKEDRPFSHKEMLATVAKDYFIHLKHPLRAKQVEAVEGTVDLFHYGDFVDWSLGSFTEPSFSFRLTKIDSFDNRHIRIYGTAASNDKSVKQQVKMISAHSKQNAQSLAEGKGLIFSTTCSWTSQGLILLEKVLGFYKAQLQEEFQFACFQSNEDLENLLRKEPDRKIAQTIHIENEESISLFQTKYQTQLQENICLSTNGFEKEWISSLKFIGKLLNILGFKHELYLCPRAADFVQRHLRKIFRSRITQTMKDCGIEYQVDEENIGSYLEFRLKDGLEREWIGATMDLVSLETDLLLLKRSTAVSLERMVALALETEFEQFMTAVQT